MVYTKEEIIKTIQDIDSLIVSLRSKPSTASVKGISSSYNGKILELLKERAFWENKLNELTLRGAGVGAAQGPGFEIW